MTGPEPRLNTGSMESDALSLTSLLTDAPSPSASVRSSFEYARPDRNLCTIEIFEEPKPGDDVHSCSTKHTLSTKKLPELPSALLERLATRDHHKTRWINVTGYSSTLVDDLAQRYLDEHGCLDAAGIGQHTLGGPIKRRDGSHFIWVQSSVWYIGQECRKTWSSVQQCGFRMVICLPTRQKAGTLITNFTGRQEIVDKVSTALTTQLLDQHSMGGEAMGCVWILASSIMRAITAQLDLAFYNFDPLDRICGIPEIAKLPSMLQQANELARIDRYTSSLNEILEFFRTVRDFQNSQAVVQQDSSTPAQCHSRISERSNMESKFAQHKVRHAQQLCRTYIKQYESHVQMMLSYSMTQIADRLEGGRKLGERITGVGVVLAAVSGVTAPLAVVTGYYGMNVSELTSGGNASLFDFWAVALPVIVFSLVAMGVMFTRVVSSKVKQG